MSVIVPVYNAEKYLAICLDSLVNQADLSIEIILVNDGSNDRSGTIVDEYAKKDNRIKVIHQINKGASAARNTGLDIAQGEYIAFVDSDDWVKKNSLLALYREAIKHHADVMMGNIWLCHQDGSMSELVNLISRELKNVFSGKEGFIWLVKTRFYLPMQVRNIYRRRYLQKIRARFEEGIMHEDELWSPVVLYQAEKIVISDIEFYYYRQNEESVMHTANIYRRLKSLFQVTDRLIEFSNQFDFSGEDGDLKGWWYVNIFRLYSTTFSLLSKVKNSSYIMPKHHLDNFWRDCCEMESESQKVCKHYYSLAVTELEKYTNWRISEWVASIAFQIKTGKRLMLIYNVVRGENLSLRDELVPADWLITTDRRYFQQADVVVFYLPDLAQEIDDDLDKPEGQIWVLWHLVETGKNYPWINNLEVKELFDLQVFYPEDERTK